MQKVPRVNAAAENAFLAPGTLSNWRETLQAAVRTLSALRRLRDPRPRLSLHLAPAARPRPPRRAPAALSAGRPRALGPQAPAHGQLAARPGFSEGELGDGLCIALGWDALHWRPGLDCFAAVHRTAGRTAAALVTLVRAVVAADPDRRVDVLSHSLGARLVLQALCQAPDLPVARAILLGAAEYSAEARAALEAQDRVGGTTEFYHMLARANDLYDGLFQLFAPLPELQGDLPLARAGWGWRIGAGSTCSSTTPRRGAG